MRRREFLKVNALLGVSTTACAGAQHAPPGSGLASDPMAPYLARLDETLDRIAVHNPAASVLPDPALLNGPGAYAGGEPLFRKSLRSLYLVSAFRDLDEQDRLHPGMQARLRAAAPEMDDAVFGVSRHLAALAPTDHRAIQETLATRPQLVPAFAADLERHGADAGMPASRRIQLRSIAARVAWRLEKQPPSVLISEYTRKVEKVAAWTKTDLDQQAEAASRAAQAIFWKHAPADPAMVPDSSPAAPRPGDGAITAGLWLLGIAAGTGALGGIFLAAGAASDSGGLIAPGVILTTVGGLLLVSGLITLLVGGIMRASNE